jgi:hypothetical protein
MTNHRWCLMTLAAGKIASPQVLFGSRAHNNPLEVTYKRKVHPANLTGRIYT